MTDRQVVAMAVVAGLAAWLSRPAPVLVVAAACAVAWLVRRPSVLCLAVGLVASTLGARSWSGVRHAPRRGEVAAVATLVDDPQWVQGAVRVDLRIGHRRVQSYARGTAAGVLQARLAGERVRVEGRLGPVTGPSRAYLARRHVGARLAVQRAETAGRGGPVSRIANELRRTLDRGAQTLGPRRRALFTGVVIGDDRQQAPEEVDDFRAAGLTHLLAVSGQNVAFVLAVAAPLLHRLGLRSRMVAGIAVLLLFGVLTRWEPSVLRAVAMGGIAMIASTAGRPVSSIRLLALAVTGLVLVDPMLSGSVGFLLSTGACVGIAVLGPIFERRLPKPLAVTLAAQIGVAPVLIPVFGGIPVASLPANLLAVPAAGPVMMWGLVAGVPAGLVGGRTATLLHAPTRLLLWWIASVAHTAAGAPLPQLTAVDIARGAAVAAGLGAAAIMRIAKSTVQRLAPGLIAAAVLLPALATGAASGSAQLDGRTLVPGVRLWRASGATVIVVESHRTSGAGPLLAGLRTQHVRRVDLVVAATGSTTDARIVASIERRVPVRAVLMPRAAPPVGSQVMVGGLSVTITSTEPRLEVRVGSPGAPRARAPTA